MASLNKDITWTPERQRLLVRKNYTQVKRKDLRPKEYCLYQQSVGSNAEGFTKTVISVNLRPGDEGMFD
jgi:hypothetical protein